MDKSKKTLQIAVFARVWGNKGISLAWEAPTGGKVKKKKKHPLEGSQGGAFGKKNR